MKKDKFRFTLRFCDVSPKQITATDVLEAAGRRKTSLIADLIDEHITKYGTDAFAKYFSNASVRPTADIEVQPSITQAKPIAIEKSSDSATNESLNDEMRDSILEGLSMFKM